MGFFNKLFGGKTGTRYYDGGDWYEGELNRDGERHGFGTYHYVENTYGTEYYTGDWSYDEKHGHGIYHWANGDEYDGEWQDGHRTGNGTYYYSDGSSYRGGFVRGKHHGYGVHKYTDGQWYEAEFNVGKVVHAIYHWPSGDSCEGNMSTPGKMDGICTYIKANGTRRRCRYDRGKFIEYL